MDVAAVLEALDDGGAGILAAGLDPHAFGGRDLLHSGLGQAGEKRVGRHIRQAQRRPDAVAGDARDGAAAGHVVPAGQYGDQHRERGGADSARHRG